MQPAQAGPFCTWYHSGSLHGLHPSGRYGAHGLRLRVSLLWRRFERMWCIRWEQLPAFQVQIPGTSALIQSPYLFWSIQCHWKQATSSSCLLLKPLRMSARTWERSANRRERGGSQGKADCEDVAPNRDVSNSFCAVERCRAYISQCMVLNFIRRVCYQTSLLLCLCFVCASRRICFSFGARFVLGAAST